MRIDRRLSAALVAASLVTAAASLATQMLAARFEHQAALGPRLSLTSQTHLYPPFAIFSWSEHWSARYRRAFTFPKLIAGLGVLGGLCALALGFRSSHPPQARFGAAAWGGRTDARAAGLFSESGVVLGKLKSEILAYDGPSHLLLTGGTRSGKTRGAVIPTLLACPHSIVALDLKGELHSGDARVGFPGTAGWRARLGRVIRFDPTSPCSDRFNFIDVIRPGPNDVRDAQNLTELIADPYGDGRFQDFWDRAAKQIIAGVILHVAYAEPPERKTLHRVFELLARFDDTVTQMEKTLHRTRPDGQGETHPEVERAAQSYSAYHEKLRAGIKATAESYLGVFSDPLVQANTSASTFRISDLMCSKTPVTLFLCWPPNDSKRVKPLMRLLFGAVLRDLMEHQERAADGRRKARPLLLLLDEFPQLGKLDLFEQSMGAMAGYGLRAFIITQSLHQITQAYGRSNTIIDNCQIVTSFAATDVETAETVSKLAGDIFEMRPQETWSGKRQIFGLDHRAITYREERRPLLLPAEVRRLPDDEELIFVTGAKPLRAQKLRYDEDPLFAARLSSAPARTPAPALVSPWASYRALSNETKTPEVKSTTPKPGAKTSTKRGARPSQATRKAGAATEKLAQNGKTRKVSKPAKDAPAESVLTLPPQNAPTGKPKATAPAHQRLGFDLRPRPSHEESAP